MRNGHGKVMEKYFVKSVGTLQTVQVLFPTPLPLFVGNAVLDDE